MSSQVCKTASDQTLPCWGGLDLVFGSRGGYIGTPWDPEYMLSTCMDKLWECHAVTGIIMR